MACLLEKETRACARMQSPVSHRVELYHVMPCGVISHQVMRVQDTRFLSVHGFSANKTRLFRADLTHVMPCPVTKEKPACTIPHVTAHTIQTLTPKDAERSEAAPKVNRVPCVSWH